MDTQNGAQFWMGALQLRKGQEEEDAGQVVFQIVTPTLRQMT